MPTRPDESLEIGDPPIAIALRRHPRARRFTLRVSRSGAGVTMTLPPGGSRAEAAAFARSREAWLRQHIGALPVRDGIGEGTVLPFRGVAHRVTLVPGLRRIEAAEGVLRLPGGRGPTGVRLRAWLRTAAQARLSAAVAEHTAALGVRCTSLALRDTRSRWGSCSAQGRLMFSWRLIMAPDAVLDYVAAHEVAHLAELNHGPRFWAHVATLMPGYEAQRDWLRRNGAGLHRFDFDAD